VIVALFGGVAGASDLPDCPSDTNVPNVRWHNCFGTYTFSSGSKYVGEFKDGNSNGQGTYTWANGNKYVGEFKHGGFNGQGTFTWSDGSKYVGEFKDGIFNGQGTYTGADGTVEEGIWKNSKFQYAKTLTKPAPVVKTPTQEKKYAASNARGAIILGLKIGQSKPNNCRPKHVQFSRRFGTEQFKAYTCSVNIDGESIRLVLNGINSPAEIIEIKRRQLFRNLDAYEIKDKAIKHYDNGDTKTSKAFYYEEYTFEYKNIYPSKLTLKVGRCTDGDLGRWRHNCLSYIEYTARASHLGEIYDGLVAASKKKQKF